MPNQSGNRGTTKDFYFEVARGNVPGHSAIIIRGHNPDVDSGAAAEEDLAEFGNITYLSTSETMDIASTDTSDAPGGDGMLTMNVSGIANDGTVLTENVTMNGSTNVTTTGSYLRVNTMTALTAGATGWNEGNITATASTAGTIQCEMDATEGVSQNSHYTVASSQTFMLTQVEFNAARNAAGQDPTVEFKGYARPGGSTAAWLQLFDKKLAVDVTEEIDVLLPVPTKIPSGTDIRLRANTTNATTEVRSRMYAILVDN